jgi:hypothetical protein
MAASAVAFAFLSYAISRGVLVLDEAGSLLWITVEKRLSLVSMAMTGTMARAFLSHASHLWDYIIIILLMRLFSLVNTCACSEYICWYSISLYAYVYNQRPQDSF